MRDAGEGILEGGTGSATGSGTDLLTLGTTVTDATTAERRLWPASATVLSGRDDLRRADRRHPGPHDCRPRTSTRSLTTNYATGVSALVDADMNTASTRLQALQTQEQLGIQSLSIANQNSQLILKLFNG